MQHVPKFARLLGWVYDCVPLQSSASKTRALKLFPCFVSHLKTAHIWFFLFTRQQRFSPFIFFFFLFFFFFFLHEYPGNRIWPRWVGTAVCDVTWCRMTLMDEGKMNKQSTSPQPTKREPKVSRCAPLWCDIQCFQPTDDVSLKVLF